MNFFEFISFDMFCFIIKIIFIFVIYKIYKFKKKNDFMTQFDFGDSDKHCKSILDIESHFDDLDNNQESYDIVNKEKL